MSQDIPIGSTETLRQKKCLPCEGGVDPLDRQQSEQLLTELTGWSIDDGGKCIQRSLNCNRFPDAIRLLNQIAELAEEEQHHPDLHLTGYRHLKIILTTHAIGGLSENDFIVATKIDRLLEG
ncbi:4a-hydroxytetrahydrobiopterin dehydratase [Rubripirellula sp.]|jgi:4a-hydroxytetrahydrobiopterin dehydratase|nr:4a-hydroxytetrahydrobiopterin dehydratase [Rubripirellula sp.]